MLSGLRVLAAFILAIVVALLLSALVNAPLYDAFPELSSRGPHKLMNTTGKLFLIPIFLFLLAWYGLNNKQALGYGLERRLFIAELFRGLLMGIGILSLLSVVLIVLDIRYLKPIGDDFAMILLKAIIGGLLGGILIGFIEETFFRGGIYGAMRKNAGFPVALLLSSLLYGSMHFIKPLPLPEGEPLHWYSGFLILQGSFDQLADWATLDSFIGLFAVGLYLAIVRERTGNLAYVIGLHAGFVFVIKVVRKITKVDSSEPLSVLVGSYDGMVGCLSATGLLIHAALTWFFWRRNNSSR
ncbi:hypothetical protein BOW39_06685 [Solemya velum gill symbiont]|nr:hypothetical protein BOW39_06685 [Solemya velum gill symbiont]